MSRIRILAIRLRMIGDIILTTPALSALRQGFPNAEIDLLVAENFQPLVAEHPALDRLIPFRRGETLKLIRDLRANRYDIVIDFHSIPRTAWLARATGAPCRIGFHYPDRGWLYTHPVQPPPQFTAHSVETLCSLLKPLGIFRHPGRVLMRSTGAVSTVDSLLQRYQLKEREFACLHAVPSNRFKRWPAASYAGLAEALAARGLQPVILGGGGDDEFIAQIQSAAVVPLISMAAQTSLLETREVIRRAALFVGPDSGPAHIAATTSVPLVVLYGPTPPTTFQPWRPGVVTVEGMAPCRPCRQKNCLPGDYRCMEIPLENVLAAVDDALTAGI